MSIPRIAVLVVALGALGTVPARAQFVPHHGEQRLTVGVSGGLFRISLDDFTKVYPSRLAFPFGGQAVVRLFSLMHIAVHHRVYSKTAEATSPTTGQLGTARWDESWTSVGIRRYAGLERRATTYVEFGLTFFNIREQEEFSVFSRRQTEKSTESAGGFFINGGLLYMLTQRLSLFLELEVSSASIEGNSGFEGSSVGGFYGGVGANLHIL